MFAEAFGVTIRELMAWEGDAEFMRSVLENQGHWISKRHVIMEGLLQRGSSVESKDQLLYAAAYLIAIGDPAGKQLAQLKL
jgi:hypothetical protein